MNAAPTGAAAPAELTCRGKPKPVADPFLVSPYGGWSEINSFLDHDNPDYRRDGEIILANGLTASSDDGMSSDFFPAYWLPALRQYISYDGHNGYDFGISYQPVLAAGDGTVQFAGWNGGTPGSGYGQMILINHHNGYVTLYGHLSSLEVHAGDKVAAGQEIGISGSTGNSSGPHLHFSVFHNCQVTDPYGWTGHGADPLQNFDGEQSAYLWVPGHDPLVLNPPPAWPTFPLGLKVPVPGTSSRLRHLGTRYVPPVDRLLLLKLPLPHPGQPVSSAVALARTEAAIAQEGEALAPYLQDLQAQGLVEDYQLIPAAAAVWARGTATAVQLEGLPGVASLGGVQPRDLIAAQAGLSHSILIQIGSQRAPSLWPVGFRSALHAWRPVTTVVANNALVTGLALPGQRVVISLHRGSSTAAAAEASGDPDNGGFVAMLHDRSGKPVLTRTGDIVEVRAGGRLVRVQVWACMLRARSHRIDGSAPPDATVYLTVMGTDGSVLRRSVSTASARGRFHLRLPSMLTAGSLAVVSVVDDAGNQESATAFVPGLQVEENSPTVRGWTVGDGPTLRVRRGGRLIVDQRLHTAADGTFQLELQRQSQPLALVPGDVVSIGSRWHRHAFTVPDLHVSLPLLSTQAAVTGPPRARVHIDAVRADGSSWTRDLPLGPSGSRQWGWPGGMIGTGDAAILRYVTPSGDSILAENQVRGLIVHAADSLVSGRVRPGTTLSIRAFAVSGEPIGRAVITSDMATGTFHTRLRGRNGRPAMVDGPIRLVVRDNVGSVTLAAPTLDLRMWGGNAVAAWTLAHSRVVMSTIDAKNGERVRRLTTDGSGRVVVPLTRSHAGPERVTVTMTSRDGLAVERSISISGLSGTSSRRHVATRHKPRTAAGKSHHPRAPSSSASHTP